LAYEDRRARMRPEREDNEDAAARCSSRDCEAVKTSNAGKNTTAKRNSHTTPRVALIPSSRTGFKPKDQRVAKPKAENNAVVHRRPSISQAFIQPSCRSSSPLSSSAENLCRAKLVPWTITLAYASSEKTRSGTPRSPIAPRVQTKPPNTMTLTQR